MSVKIAKSVKIANPDDLKEFINKYIGQVLPAKEAKQMTNNLQCMNITQNMYDKIMRQNKKVVKKERPEFELDGGFRKKRRKRRKSKKRRKSNKRRTKKNQKGGVVEEVIIGSFCFVSLLSIALFVIASPFILIKECADRIETRINDAPQQWTPERRRRENEQWDRRVAMNQSPPQPRRGWLNQFRQVDAFQNNGGSGFGDPTTAEAADRLLEEPITEMSASRARDTR